jgi:hypothetical protein
MENAGGRWRTLIKRFGIFGLAFFTIKGLLWLLVPAALVWLGLQ